MDPNIKFGTKLEEEVPLLFKRANYPFQLSKSSLQSVGSPHTWPSLVLALAWVVELLNYEEQSKQVGETGFDVDGNRAFFDYVSNSYTYFLAGDDASCNKIDEELAGSFEGRDVVAIRETERLEQANVSLSEELVVIRSSASPLEELSKSKTDLLNEVEKLNKMIAHLQKQKGALEQKVAEEQEDIQSKQEEVRHVAAESVVLRERLAVQEVNAADVERMCKEKAHLEAHAKSVQAHKDRAHKSQWDLEVRVEKQMEVLETALWEYQTCGKKLQVLPSSAKRHNPIFDFQVDATAARPEDVVSVDLKATVKPALARLKEEFVHRTREAQEELLKAQEETVSTDERVAESREERQHAEASARRAEAEFLAGRDRIEAQVQSSAAEADDLEAEVAKSKGNYGAVLQDREAELAAVQVQYDIEVKEQTQEKAGVQQMVLAALDALMVHKQHVQDGIQRVFTSSSNDLKDLQAM
ncbi:hypothetical protein CYMTET_5686 [Cymbomonas tetramitiformis]|uniref:Kinetochore protein NDC80 n=1 Tax=Cymbomonas tetramitiformis TaxID=36881 RepID=A0AAE0LJ57_9CHLO|nr:hypothetical protein CYMTET_5686 [Cymbomonas tetramitiformis]